MKDNFTESDLSGRDMYLVDTNTALEHNLTLVTRNSDDFKHTGVSCCNPFEQNET